MTGAEIIPEEGSRPLLDAYHETEPSETYRDTLYDLVEECIFKLQSAADESTEHLYTIEDLKITRIIAWKAANHRHGVEDPVDFDPEEFIEGISDPHDPIGTAYDTVQTLALKQAEKAEQILGRSESKAVSEDAQRYIQRWVDLDIVLGDIGVYCDYRKAMV